MFSALQFSGAHFSPATASSSPATARAGTSAMQVFLSKHQKLILQCYPAGKSVDKKPNPLELSYLLYYASTRRVKLEKVLVFLHRKTQSDYNHSRTGNLQVTLTILSALIDRCAENLNVFAPTVCAILQMVLGLSDVALCKAVLSVYGVLCLKLDAGLFAGDKLFVDSFTNVTSSLIGTATVPSHQKLPNSSDWKMVALEAARHLFRCIGYNAQMGRHIINLGIPLLADTVYTNNTCDALLSRIKSHPHDDLSRLVLARFQDEEENRLVSAPDLNDEALAGLKALFNTTLTTQITAATKAIFHASQSRSTDLEWGAVFLQMCTSWIPVQLRFLSLTTLLTRLTTVSRDSTSTYALQTQYAAHVLGLVLSDVNMIGLSISDVIQQLLQLQADLYLRQTKLLSQERATLANTYSKCIANLSSHIYYFDQVPDAIKEILAKLDSELEASRDAPADALSQVVCMFLDDVHAILRLLRLKQSTISRNYTGLEHWELSLPLLSPETEFVGLLLTPQHVATIQLRFLEVFRDFLHHEFIGTEDALESLTARHSASLEPDMNDYISNPENFISHLLIYTNKFLTRENADPLVVRLLARTLKDLSSVVGINFVSNFVPFFYHWQLGLDLNDFDALAKVADTLAYTVMHHSLQVLDERYPTELEGYARLSLFHANLLVDVQYRKKNGLWVSDVDPSPIVSDIVQNGNRDSHHDETGAVKFHSNKKCLQEFVAGSPFLVRWINSNKSLVLTVLKGRDVEHARNGPSHAFNYEEGCSQATSISDAIDADASNRPNTSLSGYGLGTANDITSIHSGLLNHHIQAGRYGQPSVDYSAGSIFTGEHRYINSPRVSDLRDVMLEPRAPSLRIGTPSTPKSAFGQSSAGSLGPSSMPNSVLSKNMAQHDVASIMDGLALDDDADIVV